MLDTFLGVLLNVDRIFLDMTRRCARAWQWLTGFSSFALARFFAALYIFNSVIRIVDYFVDIIPTPSFFLVPILCLVNTKIMLDLIGKAHAADEALRRGTNALPKWLEMWRGPWMAPFRSSSTLAVAYYEGAVLRTVVEGLAKPGSQYLAPLCWFAWASEPAFVVTLYILAIDPLRPGTSGLRAWFSRLVTRPALVPAPSET